ncbi:MAG: type II toxin-antitoxin system VapC family toxin [Clostridiales Family XIII bacterium]|jgi:tRNA(fMet)-specific endonuclease VapC|nr:type II toxin-antitoxin system VapC family toxin [Clostridiales Family XIII bacterium]
MPYMLDTNICIAATHSERNKKFREAKALFEKHVHGGLCISSITLAELEYGVAKSEHPEKNTLALLAFLAPIDIMSFDDKAAVTYGAVRADLHRNNIEIGALDMLIAAHALSLGLTLVTNNTREFDRIDGLAVVDWMSSDE